jgi:hypothetical protein
MCRHPVISFMLDAGFAIALVVGLSVASRLTI